MAASNFQLFGGVLLCGKLFGSTISGWNGFCGFLLLSIVSLWEIPLYMFLSARFGMLATVLSSAVLSIAGTAGFAGTDFWWLCPSAVPSRLMCPVLGILPNGLPVPVESSLWNRGVILPGIMISVSWFILLTGLIQCQVDSRTARRLDRQSGRQSAPAFGCRKTGRKGGTV